MRLRDVLVTVVSLSLASGCHMQSGVPDSFTSDEVVITGPTSTIMEATERALAESEFVTERRLMLQDGVVLIFAHPAEKATDLGSIRVRVKEAGLDDTNVRMEVRSSLYTSAAESKTVSSRTLAKIRAIVSK